MGMRAGNNSCSSLTADLITILLSGRVEVLQTISRRKKIFFAFFPPSLAQSERKMSELVSDWRNNFVIVNATTKTGGGNFRGGGGGRHRSPAREG